MRNVVRGYKIKTIIFSGVGVELFLNAVIFLTVALIIYKVNVETLEDYHANMCNIFLVLAVIFALIAIPFLIIGLTVFFRKLQNARQELADNQTQK